MSGAPLIACPHCATLHERVPLQKGVTTASCVRCDSVLYHRSAIPLDGWIALVLCALFVFAIANYFPIAVLSIQGLSVEASLPGALYLTWEQGHEILSIMTGLFGFWLPLTQLLFLLWALLAIRSGRLPLDFRHGMRLLHLALPWSMVPVLMLGILVAIVKLAGLASVEPGPAIWAYAGLTFLLTGMARLTPQRLWRYAEDRGLVVVARAGVAADGRAVVGVLGSNDAPKSELDDSSRQVPDPNAGWVAACASCGFVQTLDDLDESAACHRCGAAVHFRKPDQQARVWALVIAASILYIPANILPVMRIRTAASDAMHTILGGVIELWRLGSPDLAIIVFIASVVVPITKLLALVVLMVRRNWRGNLVQRQRTRLYELVEFIGQWSMLDVFVVILLSAMADFPGISQVVAGPGAASFGMVVILTMLAAMSYDPRTGWDRSVPNTIPRAADGARRHAAGRLKRTV